MRKSTNIFLIILLLAIICTSFFTHHNFSHSFLCPINKFPQSKELALVHNFYSVSTSIIYTLSNNFTSDEGLKKLERAWKFYSSLNIHSLQIKKNQKNQITINFSGHICCTLFLKWKKKWKIFSFYLICSFFILRKVLTWKIIAHTNSWITFFFFSVRIFVKWAFPKSEHFLHAPIESAL